MLSALIMLLGGPAAAATTTLSPELPAGFKLDGDTSEWTRPPDIVLDGGAPLAGEPASGPEDLSVRLWATVLLDGLVVAIDVRDDTVLWPEKGEDPLFSDHVSLWIALPPAELPAIGFANERGSRTLATPADCATTADAELCRTWFAAQGPRRARLSRLFVRQYTFTPAEIVETWGGACVPAPVERPETAQATCKSSDVKMRRVEGGYQLEAHIALSDFPATHQNPMNHLGLLLDAVDNDAARNAQESSFSSSAATDPFKPETFPRFDLRRPPLFDSDPPAFAALELYDPDPALFYFPALVLVQAYAFENLALGGQAVPTLPSPSVTALDWSHPRRLGLVGDLEVYEVSADAALCAGCTVGRRLILLREDQVVAAYGIGSGNVRGFALRGGKLHVVVSESGPSDPLQPGSARAHSVTALTISEDASFETVFQDTLIEGEPEDGIIYSKVSLQITPDGSAFGFVGQRAHTETPDEKVGFSRINLLDVSTGEYLPGEDALQ